MDHPHWCSFRCKTFAFRRELIVLGTKLNIAIKTRNMTGLASVQRLSQCSKSKFFLMQSFYEMELEELTRVRRSNEDLDSQGHISRTTLKEKKKKKDQFGLVGFQH